MTPTPLPDDPTAHHASVWGGGTGAAGGAEHQQELERPGRRHLGEGFSPSARALPELNPDVPAAGRESSSVSDYFYMLLNPAYSRTQAAWFHP